MSDALPSRIALLVRKRAHDCCEYCLLPQAWQESAFHIDHIRPRAARGRTEPKNLALACVGCSLKKGARIRAIDPQSGESIRLFNPRQDDWLDHFSWDQRWRIVGRTAIGRATVAALDLNRPRLVAIRCDMAALNRYPPDER